MRRPSYLLARHAFLAALLCVPALVFARTARAQDPLRIDLATAKEVDTITIAPGRYRIRVASRVPRFAYTVRVSQRDIPIPPLSGGVFGAGTGCDSLVAVLKAFKAAAREEDIPDLVRRASAARATTPAGTCTPESSQLRELSDTTEVAYPDTYTVRANQYLVVTINRSDPAATASRQWVRVFTTGGDLGWRTTYGFAFVRTSGVAKSGAFESARSYYTKQVSGTTDKFVITPEQNRQPFDAVPTIMFGYLGASERGLRWNRLTAGLGVDLTNPLVILATGWTYNANLHVSAGVAARREDVLLGRYQPGDTVATDLTGTQLTGPAFRLRPVVAVTLRFDSNPFSKGGSNEKSTEGKSEAKPDSSADSGKKSDTDTGNAGAKPTEPNP